LRPDQGEIIDYNQFAARPGIVDFALDYWRKANACAECKRQNTFSTLRNNHRTYENIDATRNVFISFAFFAKTKRPFFRGARRD
jgi:hypothetical protein